MRLMRAVVLLIFCMPTARSAATVASSLQAGNALKWHQQKVCSPTSLNSVALLPFDRQDSLLPGESLQIHLFRPHQIALFECCVQRDHGCVCQLLELDCNGVVAVAPLLELREFRPHLEAGVWAQFTCVGTVALRDVEVRSALEELTLTPGISFPWLLESGGGDGADDNGADDEGNDEAVLSAAQYLVAQARVLREADGQGGGVDYESADDEAAFLLGAVEQVHAEVNDLRRQCLKLNPYASPSASDRVTAGGDRLGPPPSADDRVNFGYRLGPLVGPFLGLDEHLELRATMLQARGVDEPPDPDLGRLSELWGCADAEAARRRMLSFVVCEGLSDEVRVGAMALADTTQRLELAQRALTARLAKLRAEVALRRAVG